MNEIVEKPTDFIFSVSVVMPVYNAAKYVEEAVKSAVNLEEVGEIILVEDGSKDDSLIICKKLEKEFEKVTLYTHENNINKGASESRNFGILMAKCPYISFLDADDLYCNDRFLAEKKVFLLDSKIDGVYSASGYINEPNGKMLTLNKVVPSHRLFHYLLRGTYGHFCTNGITVKKTIFDEVGYFNPILKLHQDAEMWLRMAFNNVLVSGTIKTPVALIRRHEGNRIWTGQNYSTRFLAFEAFFNWVIKRGISTIDLIILVRKIVTFESKIKKKSFFILFLKRFFKALVIKFT